MPAGRPTGYDPAFCDVAIEYLSRGRSVAGLAGHLRVAKQTVYNWIDQHPEFMDAVKVGQACATEWWENRLCEIAEGQDGNATAAIFGLKNRAADEWRDRQEVAHEGITVTISRDDANL